MGFSWIEDISPGATIDAADINEMRNNADVLDDEKCVNHYTTYRSGHKTGNDTSHRIGHDSTYNSGVLSGYDSNVLTGENSPHYSSVDQSARGSYFGTVYVLNDAGIDVSVFDEYYATNKGSEDGVYCTSV